MSESQQALEYRADGKVLLTVQVMGRAAWVASPYDSAGTVNALDTVLELLRWTRGQVARTEAKGHKVKLVADDAKAAKSKQNAKKRAAENKGVTARDARNGDRHARAKR